MSSKEKIYLNGIPVYRYTDIEATGPAIKYILFEDNEEIGHVLFMQMFLTRAEEYKIVLESINRISTNIDKENKINVRVIKYEQDRRSSKWVLQPSQKQTRVIIQRN